MGCGLTLKKIYIRQPAGLGDILYLQKIAHYLSNEGHTVVWPIISNFEYITKYIKIPNVSFVSFSSLNEEEQKLFQTNDAVITEKYDYIPLDIMCNIIGNCNKLMESKYEVFSIESTDWQKYLKIKRYSDREDKCRDYFGIKKGDKFVFVNPLFASPPNIIKRNIEISTNLKIIEHEQKHLEMFNLFDFSWILENAVEIHTVETSMCYLIETLDTHAKLSMYSRIVNNNNQHPNFDYIKNVYKKDWNYIL